MAELIKSLNICNIDPNFLLFLFNDLLVYWAWIPLFKLHQFCFYRKTSCNCVHQLLIINFWQSLLFNNKNIVANHQRHESFSHWTKESLMLNKCIYSLLLVSQIYIWAVAIIYSFAYSAYRSYIAWQNRSIEKHNIYLKAVFMQMYRLNNLSH